MICGCAGREFIGPWAGLLAHGFFLRAERETAEAERVRRENSRKQGEFWRERKKKSGLVWESSAASPYLAPPPLPDASLRPGDLPSESKIELGWSGSDRAGLELSNQPDLIHRMCAMEGNKDDAAKCLRIGKEALDAGDRARALKFLSKARRLDPSLAIDHLLSPLLHDEHDEASSSSSQPPPPPPPAAAATESPEPDGLRERNRKGKKTRREDGDAGSRSYTEEQVEVVRQIKKNSRDYYQILGLEKSCTVEDVRKAYRKLSLKVHPDKNKAPGAEDAFKAVSKAFQCLSDAESRKRYDLVGSDEPSTYNRRAASASRAYNGFYEDDFDPDEIFRNFFFGGMAPATTRQFGQFGQFGTFQFRTGGGMPAHAAHGSGNSTVRMLIQLLPVLLLLLLNFLPSSEPVYSLSRSYPYEHKLQTPRGVAYFVRLPKFDEDYPPQSSARTMLEQRVERDYFSVLSQNCRVELQRRQWGLSYQTPHCDMLQKFQETVS